MIISDDQPETCHEFIITIHDTSIGDLPLIITISPVILAKLENQSKRLDSDNTINLPSFIVILDVFVLMSLIND